MRRILFAGFAALLCAALAGAGTAGAGELQTRIDLEYSYSQEHLGGDVTAEATFHQKYEITYETSLTSAFDFLGAVRLDLNDAWYTDAATTSQVSPTLELQVKGSQAAAKVTFETAINTTDAFHEVGEVETDSTALSVDLELTPRYWPEMKFSYQRRLDYQAFATEATTESLEFQARKDIYDLRLEFNVGRDRSEQTLPERTTGTSTKWSAKATYQNVLWRNTDFGLSYEINETHTVDETKGVFSNETEDYVQTVRTRLKNSVDIAPRITLGLSWEYEFSQDLLELAYDYKFKNKYLLNLRWDFTSQLKLFAEASRETDHTQAVVGEDDEENLTDTIRGGFDYDLVSWLRLGGKAELKWDSGVVAGSGGSVDRTEGEKYELVAKNVWGSFWDLTLNATSDTQREDGWQTSQETKFKADLRLRWEDLIVSPSYEVTRTDRWEWGFDDPSEQKRTEDAKIRFEYRAELPTLLELVFTHEYGVKVEEDLDETLSFDSTLQFNESTKISVVADELFRDLILKGEIQRDASDVEDDPDPQVVNIAYLLDLGWKLDELVVASSLKYNDKGDAFDDLSFNAKLGWRYQRLELTGEYQFDKVYAEETEEKRKLNLRLNYTF